MSDIVERLRAETPQRGCICAEAAAEIARLRVECEDWKRLAKLAVTTSRAALKDTTP